MEYTQLTLNDWLAMKSELEEELRGAAAGFVRIGYLLRKIEEQEGYKRDGYSSLTEWAKDTYGLSASNVSRFMDINRKYSIDGYSKQLRLEYAKFGQAKLAEMLTLEDKDMEMVSPDMKRADIRELKAFERETRNEDPVEETECPAWISAFIEKFDFDIADFRDKSQESMIEQVNPSGTRMYRSGLIMASMFRDRIMVKNGPKPPERMEWQQFFEAFLSALEKRSLQKEVEKLQEAMNEPEEPVMEKDRQAQEAEKKLIEAAKMPEKPEEMPKEEGKVLMEGQEMPAKPEKVPAKKPEPAAVKEEQAAAVEEQPPAAVEEPLAPAQKIPPAIVESNENPDSAIEETEVEQVEIDEILPAPTEDPYEDLKDRFREVMNSINVMLDANNFESLGIPLARLDTLKDKLIAKKEELS